MTISSTASRADLLARKSEINVELRATRAQLDKPASTITPAEAARVDQLIAERGVDRGRNRAARRKSTRCVPPMIRWRASVLPSGSTVPTTCAPDARVSSAISRPLRSRTILPPAHGWPGTCPRWRSTVPGFKTGPSGPVRSRGLCRPST